MQKGFSAIFLLIALVVLSLVSGGAYYLGRLSYSSEMADQNNLTVAASQQPTVSASPQTYSNTVSETTNLKTYTSSSFSINYPSNWVLEESEYGIVLKKQDHKLIFDQGPRDGGVCLFDGDPDFNGPNSDYRGKPFTEINSSKGTFKRPQTPLHEKLFPVCQQGADNFVSLTELGMIMYEVPQNYNNNLVLEMDSILKTLK